MDIQPDPASAVGRGLIYTLSPIDDPTTIGTVTVTTSSSYNTASCPATPPAYAYRNPTQYTFTPDHALRDAASYVRCDLVDFDRFEPVTGLSPAPSRLGGTAYWDGTTVRPTANDGVGEMYYDGPPEQWTYRVGNTGGGNSCSSLSFAAVSLRPEGCCAPCGGSGGGDGSGRTVQEVCVIANAAPDDVMTWTRVIEDGGATIYYLDQDGARYDGTLPAGHQIVVCPVEESDTCQHCETLTLCDVQPDESPGEPEIAYEAIPLAELGPAGSYGDGSPVTGTLPNGVGYSVNVGEWGPGQGHYTFYPYDGTQVWSFTEPVYVRFGLRGLNITPTECYVLPEGAVAESISPSHTWDPDSRYLCEITGQSSATDESVFRLGPVTELPIVPSGSNTGGRGPGLIEVGFPVDAPAPGASTSFLRVVCRDCSGVVTSVTDTDLDGTPYTPSGTVTACTSSSGGSTAPPEIRLDVETALLCIRDDAGDITGQVFVERIYADQTGERIAQRLTDPTTGDEVELPDGAELVACQEPACPVAFSTECVGAVTRTEAGYDNTSTINGVPGKCGSVQGPGGQFPCQPTGALTITSWIVDGEEVIGEGGGRSFNGGPCGQGTTANRGMHHNWALALTNLDPSGANWSAQEADGCAWFVGSTGGTRTVYGAMTVQDAAGQQWILGPAQACEEVQYTKVYTQECDGTVSVSWLDAQGVATDAPEGDLVPCGTGCGSGGGAGLDVETVA
ncbi:hypothetical protein ACFV99_40730, partial [Streptomyces sp. NPDC059944]